MRTPIFDSLQFLHRFSEINILAWLGLSLWSPQQEEEDIESSFWLLNNRSRGGLTYHKHSHPKKQKTKKNYCQLTRQAWPVLLGCCFGRGSYPDNLVYHYETYEVSRFGVQSPPGGTKNLHIKPTQNFLVKFPVYNFLWLFIVLVIVVAVVVVYLMSIKSIWLSLWCSLCVSQQQSIKTLVSVWLPVKDWTVVQIYL